MPQIISMIRISLCRAGKDHKNQDTRDIYNAARIFMMCCTTLNMAVATQDLAGLH